MSSNSDIPSNRQDLPTNNNPLVEQASESGMHSSNPVKGGSGDMPKTVEEADEFQKSQTSSKGGMMDKAKDLIGSATSKMGEGGPKNPDN